MYEKLSDDGKIINNKYVYFYRDKFGKTITMTAISKGYQRIILLLSEYSTINEYNVNVTTMWTNEHKMAKTNRKNDECLGEFKN